MRSSRSGRNLRGVLRLPGWRSCPDVVAVHALRRRHEGLEAIVEVEEPRRAASVTQYGVERAQEANALGRLGGATGGLLPTGQRVGGRPGGLAVAADRDDVAGLRALNAPCRGLLDGEQMPER